MSIRKATVHRFYNEGTEGAFKNLGCGLRTVIVLPPGRKWVTIVDWTTLDTATVSITEWQRRRAEPVQYRTGVILTTMKERARYKYEDGKPTGSVKEAIKLLKGAA